MTENADMLPRSAAFSGELTRLLSLSAVAAFGPMNRALAKPKGKQHPHNGGRVPPGQARKVKFKVAVAPPKSPAEPRPEAPSPRHVWVPGYWSWADDRHV